VQLDQLALALRRSADALRGPTHLLGDELTTRITSLEERVSENQPERVVLWVCVDGIEESAEAS
jgi:hypothetical protein